MGNKIGAEIGLRISKLREAKGLSQKQLSDDLEKNGLLVKRETIAQWENGSRDLKTEYTIHLANYFGVSCDYILRGIEAENLDVFEKTGLSNGAICMLRKAIAHDYGNLKLSKAQNFFIESEGFPALLAHLSAYQNQVDKYISLEAEFIEKLSKYGEISNYEDVIRITKKLNLGHGSPLDEEREALYNQEVEVDFALFRFTETAKRIARSYGNDKED